MRVRKSSAGLWFRCERASKSVDTLLAVLGSFIQTPDVVSQRHPQLTKSRQLTTLSNSRRWKNRELDMMEK